MTTQDGIPREITFTEHKPFLIIPPDMLAESITRCQSGPETLFSLKQFFPPDLVNYLRQVLEINRHLPQFTDHSPFGRTDQNELLSLMLTQLGSLRVDRQLWFSKLNYTCSAKNEGMLHAGYTKEARKIGLEGGTFLYRPDGACTFAEPFEMQLNSPQQ